MQQQNEREMYVMQNVIKELNSGVKSLKEEWWHYENMNPFSIEEKSKNPAVGSKGQQSWRSWNNSEKCKEVSENKNILERFQ